MIILHGATIASLGIGVALIPNFLEEERGVSPSTIAMLSAGAALGTVSFGVFSSRNRILKRSPMLAAAVATALVAARVRSSSGRKPPWSLIGARLRPAGRRVLGLGAVPGRAWARSPRRISVRVGSRSWRSSVAGRCRSVRSWLPALATSIQRSPLFVAAVAGLHDGGSDAHLSAAQSGDPNRHRWKHASNSVRIPEEPDRATIHRGTGRCTSAPTTFHARIVPLNGDSVIWRLSH